MLALRRTQYIDAYYMAVFRSALGQRREARAELDRAYAENSAWVYTADVDPQLDAIRDAPADRRARRRR